MAVAVERAFNRMLEWEAVLGPRPEAVSTYLEKRDSLSPIRLQECADNALAALFGYFEGAVYQEQAYLRRLKEVRSEEVSR